MAAITTTALGLGLSGFQAYQGMKEKQQAQDDLDNFKRQDLVNPYKDMAISTVGSDYMREQNSINNASMVDAARSGGIRGVYGAIPRLVEANNDANREAQAYLDNQVVQRNYAIAGDEKAIRSMQEDRDNASLAGIGQRLEVGRQDMWSGLRGMGAAAMYGANNLEFNSTPQVEGVSELKPMGINPYSNPSPTASLPKLKGY